MRTHFVIAAAVAGLFGALACSKTEPKQDQGAQTTAAAAPVNAGAAKEMFDSRCAACHGTSGRGDGPGAVALTPKPRNYTDRAWQSGVTDDQIKKTIIYGGAAVGKSPIMPANPDLEGKPEVVDGLVKIVRGFGS